MSGCNNRCAANSWYEEEFMDRMEDVFGDCDEDDDDDVQGCSNPWPWNCRIFCIRDYRNVFDYCYVIPTFDTWDCGYWWY